MILPADETVSAQISGGENAIVPMAFIVDGRGFGNIEATITGDSILLDRSRLREVLEPLVDDQLFHLFTLNKTDLVSLDELNAMGITTEYDSGLLETRIELPVELRNVQVLYLSGMKSAGSEISDVPANFSAYINLNLRVELQSEETGSPDTFTSLAFKLKAQPVLNLHGWVLDGSVLFDFGAADETNLEYARIVKDFPGRLLRLTMGSLFSPVTGYLSPLSYAGIEIVHDPEMTRRHHAALYAGEEIIIDRPSLASVLLNGQVQRNFSLEPGRYRVQGFSFISGLNQVLFEIQDHDGSTHSLREIVPFDSRILEPGEMSFSASLGIPQWEIMRPVFTGYFLYGFFSGISGGGSLQIGLDRQTGGLEATAATRIGNFRGMVGVSLHELTSPDSAGLLEYRLAFGAGRMRPAFALQAQYLGEGYLGPNSEAGSNPYAWRFFAAANQPLPFGFGINIGVGYRIGREQTMNETTATFSLLKTAGRSVVLSFFFRATLHEGSPAEFQATFGLTAGARSGRQTLNFNTDVLNKSSSLNLRAQSGTSLGGPTIFGSLSGISPTDVALLVGSAGIQYLGPFFDVTLQDTISAGQNRLSFEAGLALVTAGGAAGISRPVVDSFALVIPVHNMENQRIVVNRTPNGAAAIAEKGSTGTLPYLASYNRMFITLEAPEAPIGLDLGDFQRILLPTYKSGIVVRVGTRATYSVEGTILLPDEKPLVFNSGVIVSLEEAGSDPIAFFTDEKGVFQAYGLLPGRYGIILKEGEPIMGLFLLPEEAGMLFPLGIFRMRASPEQGY